MKKITAILLTAILLLQLCACGKSTAETKETAAENESTAVLTEEPISSEAEPEQTANYLTLGDKIQNEKFVMTFDSMDILDEYKYSTSEYSSTSLYVEEGYMILLVRGHFENTSTTQISDSSFARSVTVNGEYAVDDYDVTLKFVRDKYFEIDPYTDLDYCLYINIPEKLAEKFESAEFSLGFNDDMSIPEKVWNPDGTSSAKTDNLYVLSCGLGTAASSEQNPEASGEDDKSLKIAIGDTISTDNYDFTLSNVEIIYELKPANTSSVYTSYTASDGKVYIHVDGQYYNKSKKDVCIRDLFTPVAEYDDGYTYDGFVVVDKGDNSFNWVSSYVICTPLETCHYHGLIECPEVVGESDAPLFITLTLADGNIYRFDIR